MNRFFSLLSLLLAAVALVMAVFAWFAARDARSVALSEIELQERNALVTPVFDQESGTWSYLAIFEWALSHSSGPAVRLESLTSAEAGGGYTIALHNGELVGGKLQERVFLTESTLQEIQTEPKRVRSLGQSPLSDPQNLDWALQDGKTRNLRVGVLLDPYDASKNLRADMVLLSFKLQFDNGKTRVVRRGIPIQPLTAPKR